MSACFFSFVMHDNVRMNYKSNEKLVFMETEDIGHVSLVALVC